MQGLNNISGLSICIPLHPRKIMEGSERAKSVFVFFRFFLVGGGTVTGTHENTLTPQRQTALAQGPSRKSSVWSRARRRCRIRNCGTLPWWPEHPSALRTSRTWTAALVWLSPTWRPKGSIIPHAEPDHATQHATQTRGSVKCSKAADIRHSASSETLAKLWSFPHFFTFYFLKKHSTVCMYVPAWEGTVVAEPEILRCSFSGSDGGGCPSSRSWSDGGGGGRHLSIVG